MEASQRSGAVSLEGFRRPGLEAVYQRQGKVIFVLLQVIRLSKFANAVFPTGFKITIRYHYCNS